MSFSKKVQGQGLIKVCSMTFSSFPITLYGNVTIGGKEKPKLQSRCVRSARWHVQAMGHKQRHASESEDSEAARKGVHRVSDRRYRKNKKVKRQLKDIYVYL